MTRIRRKLRFWIVAVPVAIAGAVFGVDYARDAGSSAERPVAPASAASFEAAAEAASASPIRGDASAARDVVVEDEDREILREKLTFARDHGLGARPLGEAIVRLGRTFVGTPYVPHVLEAPGPERLIVNLRELDCVTFVENVLAIARVARARGLAIDGDGSTGDPDAGRRTGDAAFGEFTDALRTVRYRGGEIDGYPSRLHYFSEWIADAERKGLARDVTRELGGVPDAEPIDFMSTHPDAYRQLADPGMLAAIRETEAALSERVRYYIPESRIVEVAPRIRDGDIIAATSSVEGLDVAHTGIALWIDGELHLMHAPLVGSAVEISAQPLADRILRLDGQDGIMVVRPL